MALIGISGKIGSGKDTVGQIIQVICHLKKMDIPYSTAAVKYNLEKNFSNGKFYGSWEIKKFAKKLKQIVSILTGCTVEELENQEFKNKEMDPEWEQQFKTLSFNTPEEYEKGDPEIKKQLHHYRIGDKFKIAEKFIPDYRWLLQRIGTEAMRDNIHENVWVNALFSDYKRYGNVGKDSELFRPNWIITDMRFPNEMQAVENRGGITLRIDRKIFYTEAFGQKIGVVRGPLTHDYPEHPSETALDDAKFDHTIINDGTLEELYDKVNNFLIETKII